MRILRNLLIGLVILWGLLALGMRTATPFIADYRPQIAAALATHLGVPVSIGTLQLRWYGLRPLAELRTVVLGSADESLSIDKVTLDIAFEDLLFGPALGALQVTAEGAQLTLVREPSGQLHLEGFGPLAARATGDGRLAALPGRLHLVDTELIWIDRRYAKSPLAIDDIGVVAERDGTRLLFRASLRSGSGRADLSAQLNGFLATTTWQGTSYLRVAGLDAAGLLANYLPDQYQLHGLEMDLEAWTDWQDAAPTHAQGRIELRDLDLQPVMANATRLKVAHTAAHFTAARTSDEVRIGLRELQVTSNGHQWPASNLALGLTTGADLGRRIAIAADYLRLEDLVHVLDTSKRWPGLHEPLARLQPAGELRNLRLRANKSPTGTDWRIATDFHRLAGTGFDKIPSFDGLSGQLLGQPDQLQLELDSHDTKLTFAQMFRHPLALNALHGRVDLIRHDNGWQLRSDKLQTDSPHLLSRTRFNLLARTDQSLFLDLQSDFRDGDASFADHYYPVSIMGDKVVSWLDRSIVSGRLVEGSALVYGPLGDFAYQKTGNGIFQVIFNVEDLVLDYQAGWPRLEQLDARVQFQGNQLDINAASGRIYDSQLRETTAHIASLTPASPIRIIGEVAGPLGDPLRLLRSEALRERFGKFAATLRGTGNSRLELDFAIPLAGRGKQALDGHLHFGDAGLGLPEWGIELSAIQGRLDFTLDGLSASGIRARGLGTPLTVDVLKTDDGGTRVRTRGRLSVPEIARQLPTLPLDATQGAADFVVDVDVPSTRSAASAATLLQVRSDLVGISIDLPEPLGKSTEDTRALVLRLPLGEGDAAGSLDYADRLAAQFSRDGKRIDLVLGARATLSEQPGIRIGGRLAQLDLETWHAALARLPLRDGGPLPLLNVDLQIDQLVGRALDLGLDPRPLQLALSHSAGSWQGKVESMDLAGRFRFASTSDDSALQIELDRLRLQPPARDTDTDTDSGEPPDPTAGPDPSTLPELQLKIADLHIDQAALGQLTLAVQRDPRGLRIEQLTLHGGQLALDAKGDWLRDSDGFRSRLQGRAGSPGLGDLLVGLGYSRQLEKTAGAAAFELEWPGHPFQAEGAALHGDFSLDLGPGRLVELDPGVTRIVGLLNLNALTRRLRLDFSDFYKKGYSFDSATGSFEFAGGEARTNDLKVIGPSGQIQVRGSADLKSRSLDQQVTVIPQLDATLPIAGALAGGPIAGVAVFVAQKAFAEQVDDINRFEYRINGPWVDPKIEQLSSGGTLSKILQQITSGAKPTADDAAPDQTAAPQRAEPVAIAPPDPEPQDAEADPEPSPTKSGPFRSLMRLLENSEPHGADIPGTDD